MPIPDNVLPAGDRREDEAFSDPSLEEIERRLLERQRSEWARQQPDAAAALARCDDLEALAEELAEIEREDDGKPPVESPSK